MDFTLAIYKDLLTELKNANYPFQTFRDFIKNPLDRVVMLRHDVDARNGHSLAFARIQYEMGIQGTYYFRMVKGSYDTEIIKMIEGLGHEIGYHYEDMDFARGNPDLAIQFFEKNVNKLRSSARVETLCMHGSPQSKYDNKDIWKYYRYRDYDFIGEPYFDLNFNKVFYLTDTGMMWDGFKVSVRDKVVTQTNWPIFHTTSQIIQSISQGNFPEQAMFNFHPQRWTDDRILWIREYLKQRLKNEIKAAFFVKR